MNIRNKRIPVFHLILIGLLPSFLKKIIYRFRGYKIGKKVKIGFGSVLIGEEVSVGAKTRIGFFSFIICRKIEIHRYVKIGSLNYINTRNFEIGEDSITSELVTAGGLQNIDSMLKIGERCHIMQNSFLNPTKPLIIGNDVGIGGNCQLFTHSSRLSVLEGFPVTFAPLQIKNNVWIAWNVFIFPGVTIESNTIVSAGAIVMGNIPANCIASGNPAKVKLKNTFKPVDETGKKLILEDIFSNFNEYIVSFGFHTDLKSEESNITLTIDENKSVIYYRKSGFKDISLSKNSLFIVDADTDITNFYNKNKRGQVLSLARLQRIGSSRIGEEFTRYLSRYGIRFKRLD